ncbi:MAG: malonyl-CoA decarboxylase [Pseudomonadota bacterium]
MFENLQNRAALIARDGLKVRRLVTACHKLLSERGEAAGVSLAKETLEHYQTLDKKEQVRFFLALAEEFSPDPKRVQLAAQAYAENPSAENLAALNQVVEPPRQEVFRRLNRAPGGTGAIVRLRERLLDQLRDYPQLRSVDWDLHHLLSSWFNPGFLTIVQVDWHTPAFLLEKIIKHEAVHEIQGWNDLHRRLEADRRCFAFFHPALPEEPLIFVEVALVDDMPDQVAPLLRIDAASGEPRKASTAVFYSISNCQPGLRRVSLGNFLIKQVADLLSAEFPKLRHFCTLSPIPGFSAWLARQIKEDDKRGEKFDAALKKVASALGPDPAKVASDPKAAPEKLAPLKEPLTALCATYLVNDGRADAFTRDPVARFHLSNGARMERINFLADESRNGLRQSLGLMVNYVYERRSIEANHEQFVQRQVVASRAVRGLLLTK